MPTFLAQKQPSPSLDVATADNISEIMSLVNDAYQVETGDSGVSFKKVNRYVSEEVVRKDFEDGLFFIIRLPLLES